VECDCNRDNDCISRAGEPFSRRIPPHPRRGSITGELSWRLPDSTRPGLGLACLEGSNTQSDEAEQLVQMGLSSVEGSCYAASALNPMEIWDTDAFSLVCGVLADGSFILPDGSATCNMVGRGSVDEPLGEAIQFGVA
jgi:hypothetical protein